MIELLILAGVAIVVLGAVILALLRSVNAERAAWATERKVMLDRIVARHSAEVVALDREQRLREVPPEPRPPRDIPIAEGL